MFNEWHEIRKIYIEYPYMNCNQVIYLFLRRKK